MKSVSVARDPLFSASASGTDSGRSICYVDRSSELAWASVSLASPGSAAARVVAASPRSDVAWAWAELLTQDAARLPGVASEPVAAVAWIPVANSPDAARAARGAAQVLDVAWASAEVWVSALVS